MATDFSLFQVPDVLGIAPQNTEDLFRESSSFGFDKPICFDMTNVRFIKPYGAIALVMILRRLAVISQQKISIMNIRPDVLKYLERMDFFTIAGSWVESNQLPDEQWSRNPHSPNLLELTVISSQEDVTRVVTRA